jgi:glycerol-3-phosphate dehydrogenase subunit B
MKPTDVIVIGGGLAGLTAAAAAAKQGKQILLITKGVGTIAIGGGTIDVLGYGGEGRPVASPAAGLAELGPDHPYTKVGAAAVAAALDFFLALCSEEGHPYFGGLKQNYWVPTAVGTLKPTCLVPKTMDPTGLEKAEMAAVIGFVGLKDYYPDLLVRGLQQVGRGARRYAVVMCDAGMSTGRDVTALDIARWLDTDSGRQAFGRQLRDKVAPGTLVLTPPVLGTLPGYAVLEEIERVTGCRLIETCGLPPAVTGLRLFQMLLTHLKRRNVKIIEQADVAKAVVAGDTCTAVITHNSDRDRTYEAKSFVLASGGFYSGGLEAVLGGARERVFGLPVRVPADQDQWGNAKMFSNAPQPFARFGVDVDPQLRPLDGTGKVLLRNVHVVGSNLSGFDDSFEKSGNGVAIVTGYQAGISA